MTQTRPRAYGIRSVYIALAIKRAIERTVSESMRAQLLALRHVRDAALGASPASPPASGPESA